MADLCQESIMDFNTRTSIAISKMNYQRIPLSVADRQLYEEIERVICDYCQENEISIDFFDDLSEDIEQILFA